MTFTVSISGATSGDDPTVVRAGSKVLVASTRSWSLLALGALAGTPATMTKLKAPPAVKGPVSLMGELLSGTPSAFASEKI